jgi:hypothetical protein
MAACLVEWKVQSKVSYWVASMEGAMDVERVDHWVGLMEVKLVV